MTSVRNSRAALSPTPATRPRRSRISHRASCISHHLAWPTHAPLSNAPDRRHRRGKACLLLAKGQLSSASTLDWEPSTYREHW